MIKHALLMITALGSLFFWVSSCDVVNDVLEQCEPTVLTTPCDVTYETCTDSEKTSYTFDGNTYECDDVLTGCNDAFDELSAAIQEFCDNQ